MDITSVLWIAGIFCIILVVSEIVTDILYKVCPPFRRWIDNEMEEGEIVNTKWIPELITNQIIVGLTGNAEQQDEAWEFLSSDVCQMLIDYRFDGGAVDG